jgi:hypothetical protein
MMHCESLNQRWERLNGEEKRLLRDIKVVKDIEDNLGPDREEQLPTTNGVF